ncbi:MotA/TolQ/ExbB proton channel family protein [Moritella viscosa]|uniref:MotA/TolQ/ExbB proton channel family protein n=2 Tax=Moritella viscosa TaxID=80854 RepID=A0ABY1HC83_9GAMM|nr:MotA/TolQ/ExbB proton channel family protein [Moritella viscosa]SGY91002.1 MotA/TolQ/ExbB proton channel family protein [Moritella viscosa]SGZ00757.1 MotA/TolQ/ExbB proton channel family protein [Moritella viscosa]SHO06182.1 MotA/TolQ/ExbB proton channel family protein [Moritella viscosa]SHO26156.1 MotA/TolQ/ExbB proton channel family protein [Moritella viscosa]
MTITTTLRIMPTYFNALLITTSLLMFNVNATPLDDLLKQVKQSNVAETKIDNEALTRFKSNLATQEANLAKQAKRNQTLQQQMTQLQNTIAGNNKLILAKQKLANSEKSDLDNVFSEFRRASQDLRGQLNKSPLSAILSGRSIQLSPYSEANFEPNLVAIKNLWLLFTEQMVASSKVTTTETQVTMANGSKEMLAVTQIAGFTAFTAQGPLLYQPASESYQLLPSNSADMTARIAAFSQPQDGFVSTLIDPSAGALLERATQVRAWWQVFSDAGVVGGIIVAVGIIGMTIGLFRLLVLTREAKKIELQKQQLNKLTDNPLGRIISVAERHERSNADELARFLDEAILAELPECRKGLGSIAVLATIAPLLGLLGTVAGMIETFQAITAYGNSDPQVLSSGISQALLTTKFGLIAAVPLMLLHSLLTSKSDSILHVIEHQSAGLLAQRQQRLSLYANEAEPRVMTHQQQATGNV